MEKEKGQIKFIETDDGYRIEIKGKDLKEFMSCCCCIPSGNVKAMKMDCCEPEKEGK